MANWTPKITYTELGTGTPKTITFSSPAEGDPFNEEIQSIKKVNQSSDGTTQTQWSYNKQIYDVKFTFQTSAVKALFDTFVEAHAFKGGVFTYQPHSDESTGIETFQMVDNKVSYGRPISDGSGDFEYDFGFKIERVLDFTYEEETVGEGLITETQFTIANNQSSAANVSGLAFNDTETLGAVINYAVQRKHTTPNTETVESGTLEVVYNSTDDDWSMRRSSVGDAGLTLTITTAGQVQYESTNISGSVDTSVMRFRANTISPAE